MSISIIIEMDFSKNKSKIFKTCVIGRHGGISGFHRKATSDIIYNEGDDLYMGVVLQTNYGKIEYYSIATGKTIEKQGKKYYEVYPDVYTYDQMKIINAALRTMRWADAPQDTPYK